MLLVHRNKDFSLVACPEFKLKFHFLGWTKYYEGQGILVTLQLKFITFSTKDFPSDLFLPFPHLSHA